MSSENLLAGLALMSGHFAMQDAQPQTEADRVASDLHKLMWPAVVKWFEEAIAAGRKPEDMTDALIDTMANVSAAVVCCIADMLGAPSVAPGKGVAEAIRAEMIKKVEAHAAMAKNPRAHLN